MRKLLISMVALGLVSNAMASDWKLTINLASKHFTTPPVNIEGYNENNPGIGLEFQLPAVPSLPIAADKFYIHGGYIKENSHGQTGHYLGIGRTFFQNKYISAGVEFNIADGYFEDFNFDDEYVYYDGTEYRFKHEIDTKLEEVKRTQKPTETARGVCLSSAFTIIKNSGPKLLYCGRLAALQYQISF